MARYTYSIKPGAGKEEAGHTYKQSSLEKMTTFQLREICRKERLVFPSRETPGREELVHLIMRFRGQKEHRHMTEGGEEGLERLQDFLNRLPLRIVSDDRIRIPGTLTLYRGAGANELDGYILEADMSVYEGNLLLTDEENRIYTCLYIRSINDTLYLFHAKEMPILKPEKARYSILYFPDERMSDVLYDQFIGKKSSIPGYAEAIRIPLLSFEVRDVEETDMPLVIDFGSSNTTMGICMADNSRRIAKLRGGETIPSVIGIEQMNGEDPVYAYGYDALELCRQNYRDEDVPVFYDIKRWISDPDRMESVIMKNGHKYSIPRRDMLRAYLNFLLDLGKQQFKCAFKNIQMLAPVRQKEKFEEVFKELLPDHNVACELDEGMAVLFQNIDAMIRRSIYQQGKWYRALIIDCGGGTTDLTSGKFRIDNNRVSFTIDLETSYENGDTNFGGNNLTYRMFQSLKLKMLRALDLLQLREELPEGAALEEAMERAEQILPTRFRDYEGRGREEYFYVKNNFYYLFTLAEEVKKRFFRTKPIYELSLSSDEKEQPDLLIDRWRLSIRGINGELRRLSEHLSFAFHLYEVEAVLRPDIYALMDRFLGEKYDSGEVSKYSMIKLTGQSCKSNLFMEALKEYVPGRRIQGSRSRNAAIRQQMAQSGGAGKSAAAVSGGASYRTAGNQSMSGYAKVDYPASGSGSAGTAYAGAGNEQGQPAASDSSSEALKLCCLEGGLSYFTNIKLGYMRVNRSYEVSALPYQIMAYTHENKEQILIQSLSKEDHIGCISRFRAGRQLDLYLNNADGERLRTYSFVYDSSSFQRTTQEEINQTYHNAIIQEETDTILEGETKFFVWVSRKRWGFVVLPILRSGDLLSRGEETFFSFEDDTWELNFFDGRK